MDSSDDCTAGQWSLPVQYGRPTMSTDLYFFVNLQNSNIGPWAKNEHVLLDTLSPNCIVSNNIIIPWAYMRGITVTLCIISHIIPWANMRGITVVVLIPLPCEEEVDATSAIVGEECVAPYMGARGFPADLNSHLTSLVLWMAVVSQSRENSNRQESREPPCREQHTLPLILLPSDKQRVMYISL